MYNVCVLPIMFRLRIYNNHENFNEDLGLKIRSGSAADRDNLFMNLRYLDFQVSLFNDLTFKELKEEIVICKTNFHIFYSKFFLIYIIFKY